MTDITSALESARQAVLKARVALCMRVPFLATALLSLPVKTVTAGIGTAATDGYRIYISTEFAASLRPDEIQGLLAHELLHAVFQHPARRKDRDPKLWNIACDYAVNGLLLRFGFSLPGCGLFPPQHFENLTAEAIYDSLKDPWLSTPEGKTWLKNARRMSRDSEVSPSPGCLPSICCPDEDRSEGTGEENGKGNGERCGDLIDPASAAALGREPSDPDPRAVAEIASRLRRQLVQGAKAAGVLPGETCEEITAADRRDVDWRVLMLRHMTEVIKTDWRLFPPSKRFVSQGIYLPSCGEPALGRIVFAIDTSGSMSQRDIAQILAELEGFRETFRCSLTVVQADTKVQKTSCFDPWETPDPSEVQKIIGRGGTDFRPVFQWLKEESDSIEPPAVLIYATDGYGPFPDDPPEIPVIWLVTEGGTSEEQFPKWGQYVRFSRSS